jgi:hypothetical protein
MDQFDAIFFHLYGMNYVPRLSNRRAGETFKMFVDESPGEKA